MSTLYHHNKWPTVVELNENFIYKELDSSMKFFLSTLPEKWQQLYDLKYVYEEKSPEICEKLSISESNYWVMTHRLKISLQEWYLKHWN
jgi:DNA-directed RNA polymerase specialized sigma subunit